MGRVSAVPARDGTAWHRGRLGSRVRRRNGRAAGARPLAAERAARVLLVIEGLRRLLPPCRWHAQSLADAGPRGQQVVQEHVLAIPRHVAAARDAESGDAPREVSPRAVGGVPAARRAAWYSRPSE